MGMMRVRGLGTSWDCMYSALPISFQQILMVQSICRNLQRPRALILVQLVRRRYPREKKNRADIRNNGEESCIQSHNCIRSKVQLTFRPTYIFNPLVLYSGDNVTLVSSTSPTKLESSSTAKALLENLR